MPKSFLKEVNCENCGKLFTKRIQPTTKRHYCSWDCKTADKNSFKSEWTEERRVAYSAMNKGENNPNFGKHWSDSQKKEAAESKIQQYKSNPEYRYKVGASNRGVKFSAERIKRMHENRTPDSYKRFPSEEVKKVIGQKSKEKWTPEYKEQHRRTMEDLGHWIPKSQIHPYRLYYKEANWADRMVEYFDDLALINLKQFGIFSKKNSKGFVRDHIVQRKIGFEFNLPPYILRHPANLQFISHAENIKKGFSDRKLTVEEKECIINLLLEKILTFEQSWKEQDICINFIKERRCV